MRSKDLRLHFRASVGSVSLACIAGQRVQAVKMRGEGVASMVTPAWLASVVHGRAVAAACQGKVLSKTPAPFPLTCLIIQSQQGSAPSRIKCIDLDAQCEPFRPDRLAAAAGTPYLHGVQHVPASALRNPAWLLRRD